MRPARFAVRPIPWYIPAHQRGVGHMTAVSAMDRLTKERIFLPARSPGAPTALTRINNDVSGLPRGHKGRIRGVNPGHTEKGGSLGYDEPGIGPPDSWESPCRLWVGGWWTI